MGEQATALAKQVQYSSAGRFVIGPQTQEHPESIFSDLFSFIMELFLEV